MRKEPKTRKRSRCSSTAREESDTPDIVPSQDPPKKRRRRTWEEVFMRLSAFFHEHGHLRVTTNMDLDLWHFLNKQRREYRQMMNCEDTSMCAEKIVALESIGMQWEIKVDGDEEIEVEDEHEFDVSVWLQKRKRVLAEEYVPDHEWEQRIQELKEHLQIVRNMDTTAASSLEVMRPELRKFVQRVREDHAHLCVGLPSNLARSKIRRQELQSIGFFSSSEGGNILSYDEQWEDSIRQLSEYKLTTGHFRLNRNVMGYQLWNFVVKQRRDYQLVLENRMSALTEERKLELDELGYEFFPGKNYIRGLETRKVENILREIRNQPKKCDHRLDDEPKIVELRNNCKRVLAGSFVRWLLPEHMAELMSLGFMFDWSKPPGKHDSYMKRLREIYQKFGHCNCSDDEKDMAKFKMARRKEYTTIIRNGKYHRNTADYLIDGIPSIIIELYYMGFDWGIQNTLMWNMRMGELGKYENCIVPRKDNMKLANFVSTHLTIYKLVMKRMRNSDSFSSSIHERMIQMKKIGFDNLDENNFIENKTCKQIKIKDGEANQIDQVAEENHGNVTEPRVDNSNVLLIADDHVGNPIRQSYRAANSRIEAKNEQIMLSENGCNNVTKNTDDTKNAKIGINDEMTMKKDKKNDDDDCMPTPIPV